MRLGDPQQAIAPLAEAVTKWPEDDQVRRRLALAYAAVPQHKDALATIEPYLAKHPADHEALLIATHAIYVSTLQGQPLVGVREDRERMDKYARAYAAASRRLRTDTSAKCLVRLRIAHGSPSVVRYPVARNLSHSASATRRT